MQVKNIFNIFLFFSLSLLFAFQNEAFNAWMDITPNLYFLRRFLVSLALGFVFYSPSLLLRKKVKYIYLFIISAVISSVFIAQYSYYEYCQNFLQISAVKYANQIFSLTGTIKTLLNFKLLFFLFNIFFVIAALVFSQRKKIAEIKLSVLEKAIYISAIVMFAVFSYNFLLKSEIKEWGSASRLYADSYDMNTLVGKIGVVNFTLEDAVKYFSKRRITQDEKEFLKEFARNRQNFVKQNSVGPPKNFGLALGRNLIIIEVESLENAVIGQKIGGQEITPNLNILAEEGLYFSNYYAQVFSGNTADAEFVTMNSLYPLPDDVVFVNYAQNKYKAFPEMLKKNGYHTYILHGDVPSFWNRANIYPQLGIDKTFDLEDYVATRSVGEGPSDLGDQDFFSQSLSKLEKIERPFLTTLITMSSHTPFILPEDLKNLQIPVDTKLSQIQQNYLQSINYTDKTIGEFIKGLKGNGLYDNSVIAIFGDHQSYTDIWKPFGTGVNDLPGLANSHVPLIVISPGADLKGEISTPASHLDFYPTMANIFGIIPPNSILGQDILNTENPVVVKRNIGSGRINTILSKNLAYEPDKDGVFERGICFQIPEKTTLPVSDCFDLYSQQNNIIKASDIVIRGDLIDYLK